jgi:hypothetical protein
MGNDDGHIFDDQILKPPHPSGTPPRRGTPERSMPPVPLLGGVAADIGG